ncbi:DNA ligase 1 isoform X2 [Syngnathoides biaculeatus]|uniref:DNA ligase 1 isoform X2 n=1 Tax=Syngnathoides biaculeatus TaxID=300417 RepID=UPI002ADD5C79|nr:DNA ligase 1 isoform X2 [Syngnathoides biaculeatus]
MQRSIASFFQPKTKDKDVQKKANDKPVKSPLKAQNGVQEEDSPVKKVPKRTRRILDSDDDEQEVNPTKQQVKEDLFKAVPALMSPPPPPRAPATPATPASPASSMSPDTPNSVSSSGGISKRKTARKMFPKRKLADSLAGSDGQPQEDATNTQTVPTAEGQPSKRARVEDGDDDNNTERKMFLKRKLADSLAGSDGQPQEDATNTQTVPTAEGQPTKRACVEDSDDDNNTDKVTKQERDDEAEAKRQVRMPDKNQEEAEDVEKKLEDGEEEKRDVKEPKEKAKKAPVSSFFAPRKASVKTVKKRDGEKKNKTTTSPSVEDSKDAQSESLVTETDYNPSRTNYHPLEHAFWKEGQKVPYLAVARTFEKIEEDSGRLRNIETLANLFRSVLLLSPDDLLCCVYLCLNQLGPAYLGLELGVGETVLMKAVAQATGRQLDKIKAEAQERGDLGLVAASSRSNQRTMFRPASLTVGGVFKKLKEIAGMSGHSAMNKKIDIIKGLFVACRFSEARYIVRSLVGKLRIGLAEQSVLSALSQAVCLTTPEKGNSPAVIDAGKGMTTESRRAWIEEKSLILKQTYCEMPNYDILIPVLLKEGIDQLPNHCKLTPGVPLRPMLAHPTKGVGEVMKRFDEAAFTCEYKYDGERAQIHILESGEVQIFSRNQEDNTSKYPDIISRIPKVKKDSVVSCVLDSEAVAWDREKKQIQPFQVLTTRKRKDVDASDIKVQVCVYAFDLLYLNGESLVRQPLCRRRALLRESFAEVEGEFLFARYLDSDNTETIAEFLEQSVRDSCEGLMVKTLEKDATYEIAKRSHNWLKLKKDYLEGVGDTVDLCVIGAYLGKGKRTGTYGGFLLACYDEDNEEFQSVCKIGTGFKDEDLEQHHKFLKEHILPKPRPYYRVDQSAEPDVWLDAVQVWEVKCADLSLSPVYKAATGLVDPEKGISLRFPRFLRIRDDKKPEDSTSGAQIADLYKKQQQIQNQGDKADTEDYY